VETAVVQELLQRLLCSKDDIYHVLAFNKKDIKIGFCINTLKISIAGSWKKHDTRQWGLEGSYNEFKEACTLLGKSIATQIDDAIVKVLSDGKETADYYVVQGIVEAIKKAQAKKIRISIDVPRNAPITPKPYGDLARSCSSFFSYEPSNELTMTSKHFKWLEEADVVITIGGGHTTYLAGYAAILSKKRLLPIGSFGGASQKILDNFVLDRTPENEKDNVRGLTNPWSEYVCQSVLELVKDFPKVMIVHGHSEDYEKLRRYLEGDELKLPKPVVMKYTFGEGKTLPEKFEDLASNVHCAIVIATPDDEGRSNENLGIYSKRASEYLVRDWLVLGIDWKESCNDSS
jgi:hypothetical protein